MESTRPIHDESLCGTPEYGDCFGCHARGVRLGKPSDFPTRSWRRMDALRQPANSYERGVPVSVRPDGSRVPYLRSDGEVMGQKEFDRKAFQIDDNRQRIEAEGRALAST